MYLKLYTSTFRNLIRSQDAIGQITIDAQFFADWVSDNDLDVILNKTKAMILGSSKNLRLIQQEFLSPIIINGVLLFIGKPSYLRELFVDDDDNVRRSDRLAAKKNNVIFRIPSFTINYEYSFVITVIRLWHELPSDIVNASSLEGKGGGKMGPLRKKC
ncbi:Protein of unknown function [Cotesia congregata]|uniref:Uncharacterized protein n=1 Tax=Cotesia congregata TaxID=51543 RepID=A0A8J2HI92_COTCN|nr:Protein of unknown function [Cotesia congregata]